MKQLPGGTLGFAALLGIMVAAGIGAGVAYSASTQEETVHRAPDSNFPEPVIEVLETRLNVPGTSLSFSPPADSKTVPAVDGTTAVEKAEDQFGPSAFPERVIARLAWEEQGGRLVWAVSFQGICVPDFGPAGFEHDPCGTNEWMVVVDASTGVVDGMVSFRSV